MHWSNFVQRAFGVIAFGLVGVLLLNVAQAAEWAEPTAIPPSANPPGFVWTRSPMDPAQPGGQFNIAGAGRLGGLLESLGGAVFGSPILDLGVVAGGQNLIYGAADAGRMHRDDALLLLQARDGDVFADRIRVNRDGNIAVSGAVFSGGEVSAASRVAGTSLCIGVGVAADCKTSWPSGTITGITAGSNLTGGGVTGNVTIGLSSTPSFGALSVVKTGDPLSSGNLSVAGCLGPVFLGRTTTGFQGNVEGVTGYLSANSRCNAVFAGSHVCTTAEVLNSINCSAIAAIDLAETDMWIANLAPSLPTPTNDCVGWTTASSDWWGIKWRFNKDTGGGAFAERCSTSLPFACCR